MFTNLFSIQRYGIFLALIGLFCSASATLPSEKPNDANIKTALVYAISQHFEWPVFAQTDSFLIGVYGTDAVMDQSLKQIEKRIIKGRPVKVLSFPELHNIRKTDILFVNYNRNYEIDKVYRLIKSTNTLLITDRYEDQQTVMINFVHDGNNKISFEINKRNIDEEQIIMSPKILLLGGTEIDIRELYLQTEKVLELEKTRVIQIENQLKSKEKELNLLNEQIDSLENNIQLQNSVIQQQQDGINLQKKRLLTLQDSLHHISRQTESMHQLLDSLNQSLLHGNSEKNALDQQLAERNKEVDMANQKLDLLYGSITQKEKILHQQVKEIRYLRRSRQIIFTALILFLILIVTVLRSYQTIRRKNHQIKIQSELVLEQKDELLQANEELKVQKEALQDTLEALQRTQDQLIESEKMASLGQLSAGIAHEINNPINFISSSIEGLKVIMNDLLQIIDKYNEVTPENILNKLSEIEHLKQKLNYEEVVSGFTLLANSIKTGVDRTKEIVNSMRVFYHTGNTDQKQINLNKLLSSTVILLHNQLKGRIQVQTHYGEIPKIACHPGMISQAFLNILDNAIQAINGTGTITITTQKILRKEREYIQIDIEDTGSGIPPEIAGKIFDPFFTTKEVGKGTGLGMYLTYSIIHKHQGEITFESESGAGTTFQINLPVQAT